VARLVRRLEEATLGAFRLLTAPPVPRHLARVPPRRGLGLPPRVVIEKAERDMSVEEAAALLDALLGTVLGSAYRSTFKDAEVLVKPNFNSAHPYPASTELRLLAGTLVLLKDLGARLTVGESSGAPWWPTRRVLTDAGLLDVAGQLEVPVVIFEEQEEWVWVETRGDVLPGVAVARAAYEAEVLLFLSLLKTHRYAGFSLSLKSAFGLVHPGQRRLIHASRLQEKIGQLAAACRADLVIADGREAFVTEGPTMGDVARPGLILASSDQVACDMEGVAVLGQHGARALLARRPGEHVQIRCASRLLHRSGDEYEVLGPAGARKMVRFP